MRRFFYYLRWIFRGKPTITYSGYNCGCCGKWYDEIHVHKNYYTKENIDLTKDEIIELLGEKAKDLKLQYFCEEIYN
jgi:hypothetical protein